MMNFFLESITFDYVYECLNHDFKAVSSDSFAASTSRNFYTSIQKTSRCAVTTGILYDSFNACTILLTLSM